MNIKVFQNRKIERDYFYNEGTQNENNITVLTFEVPLGYEDFSKRIVFITEDGNFWDYIPENQYELKNNITKYGKVEVYLWLTKDEQDFRSETFELNFYDNENADDLVPTEEEIDGFKTLVAELDLKIAEVEALKVEIGDFREALNSKASKEELKEVDDKFDNYYPKAETYNKTEIDNKISVIPKFNRIVVDELPTENIQEDAIYLVPSQGDTNDLYREYIYIDNKWELIGIQKGDLSNIYTKQEVDEMVKEIQETNEYQSEIIDQFKNEFKQITVSGDSIYIADAAELPMELVPYGEPVQTVIEEELGTTIEGESVVVSGGNPEKEVKDVIYGMSKQETTEGYNELLNDKTRYTEKNGITATLNSDKTIILNGTATAYTEFVINGSWGVDVEKLRLIANQKYKVFLNSNDVVLHIVDVSTIKDTFINNREITPTTDIKITNTILAIERGKTFNNVIIKPMIYKYDGTDKPFEPYTNGASPNTEYKQDIEVIDTVNLSGLGTPLNGYTETAGNSFHKDNTCIGYLFETKKLPNVMTFGSANGNRTNVSYYNEIPVEGTPSKENTLSYASTKTIEVNKTYNYIFIQFSYNITEVNEIMLNKGTELKPYLPYGHIGLVQRGKNIFDEVFRQGNLSNNSDNHYNRLFCKNSPKLKGNTYYTISTNLDISKYKYAVGLAKKPYPVLSTEQEFDSGWLTTSSYTFKPNGDFYLGIPVAKSNGTDNIDLTALEGVWFQVEEGTVATEYEPYIEPIVHEIDLAGEKLAKVDIADILKIYTNGDVQIKDKVIKEYVFTGDEYVGLQNISNNTARFDIANIFTNKIDTFFGIYCNYLRNENTNLVNTIRSGTGEFITTCVMYVDTSIASTPEGMKAWLKEKYNAGEPLKVLYETTEPQTINLPSIEPITLFEGTNIFELVTNLGTTMALTYDYVTPSPSIDRPSEILTVSGGYDTEKANENFLPLNYESNSITQNGVTVSFNKSTGKFKVTGKATTDTWFNIYPIFKAGTSESDAKESINIKNKYAITSIDNWGHNAGIHLMLGSAKFSENTLGKSRLFTTETLNRGWIYIPKTDITLDTEFWLMICDEYNHDTYVPHQSTNLPLTLTNELLGEIVTLTEEEADTLKLDGAGKYRRTDYLYYKLDENDNWQKSTKYIGNYYIATSNHSILKFSKDFGKIYCNRCLGITDLNNFKINSCLLSAGGFNIWLTDGSEIDTVEKWLEYIKNNEIYIIFKLAKPTYEKITDETVLAQLKEYDKQIAFYGINNINTYPTDDLVKAPLKIHATYSKSNKLTIQSLEDRLASLESQVTNLQDNQI